MGDTCSHYRFQERLLLMTKVATDFVIIKHDFNNLLSKVGVGVGKTLSLPV